MRVLLLGAAAVLVTGVAAGAAPAAPAVVAPADIQATFFTGTPFTAATPSNTKFKMVFTADGKTTRTPVAKGGAKGSGTWKLSNDGFCTTWGKASENCFRLMTAGDNKWSVMKGNSVVATWSK